MSTEAEAGRAVEIYADTVRRVCFMHLKNYHDVGDVFQDVFLKYVLYEETFESDVHEKARLIRVAINSCKDILKSFFRRKVYSLQDVNIEPFTIPEESRGVLDAVLKLPEKYRDAIYLFYYEGHTAVEIAKMLDKKENTVYTWLSLAKAQLKDILRG